MNLKKIHEAIDAASKETSHYLTAHVRAQARNHQWPDHVVNNMTVRHDSEKGFTLKIPRQHQAEARDHEYGTPDRRPTAAMRKLNNRTGEAENFLLKRTLKHLKGYL